MSDGDGYKRKHESGYIKRQKKQRKEDALKKMKVQEIVIPEPEPMLTHTVEQCGCAMSFTSEPVIQADAEPTVADLGLGIRNSKESISNDPAEWEINADLIAYYAENIPSQNLKSDLSLKGRQFGEKIRYVRKEYFIRKLVNGEIVSRDWLIYSPSTGKVFCYICKIFGCKTGSAGTNNAPRNQFITGFDDWKNVIARIISHKKSKDHFAAVSMIMQYKKSTRIDVELQKENEKSCKYWTEVLKRVVVVIKFLAERGLVFCGDNQLHNSPNNGNYLVGCIDLLAEFDPFLREYIQRYGNPGNIDSTPDISHVDELTLVIRYVLKNRNVVERFLQFIPIEHHDGEYVFNLVVGILQFHRIDIKNCRSQSYDNASNMSGIYSGVQARFREINHLAEWVPCAAHSLNLVSSAAVEGCSASVNYFGVIQSVYNFFSASTKRWSILIELLKENLFVLQSLLETRWSSRSDAIRAFYANYLEIRQALCEVTNSRHQPPAAVHEAKSLVKHLDYFETALINTSNPSLNVSASDNFRIQQYYVIIDRLNNEMEKRRAAYKVLYKRFNFLLDNKKKVKPLEVVAKTKALIQLYPSDLEDEFTDKFLLFSQMFSDGKSARIKTDKNYLRSTMGQARLSSLALLSIENEVMREMKFEDVIVDFANTKSRKVNVI
ncbi:zinc finger MYM-type protein 1-like [Hydra vulgaris]|uniref:Zinc finger MYM-type protein 1-like n=1 Tax=Hydra vulgaris TaxID=6087 RepID=A0ABM4CRK1_HYDVU